ncbi:MAG TPA: hypothetical protein VH482_17795 [Thermomicrobiales bacterium]
MRPLVLIGVIGVATGLAGMAVYASEGLRSAVIAGIVGLALGTGLAAIGVGRFIESRSFRLRRRVPIPAGDIHDRATSWFGRAPWALARIELDELVYWRKLGPHLLPAIFFFLFGVIPGVIYLLLARGSQTVALGIFPTEDGTDLEIVVHPQGEGGRRSAVRFFNSLHELA